MCLLQLLKCFCHSFHRHFMIAKCNYNMQVLLGQNLFWFLTSHLKIVWKLLTLLAQVPQPLRQPFYWFDSVATVASVIQKLYTSDPSPFVSLPRIARDCALIPVPAALRRFLCSSNQYRMRNLIFVQRHLCSIHSVIQSMILSLNQQNRQKKQGMIQCNEKQQYQACCDNRPHSLPYKRKSIDPGSSGLRDQLKAEAYAPITPIPPTTSFTNSRYLDKRSIFYSSQQPSKNLTTPLKSIRLAGSLYSILPNNSFTLSDTMAFALKFNEPSIFDANSRSLSALQGSSPQSIQQRMVPALYTSTFSLQVCPVRISGAMLKMDPLQLVIIEFFQYFRASPKSAILMFLSLISRFADLRSRCTTPAAPRTWRPLTT